MSAVQRQTGRRAGNWIGQCRLKDRPISENHSPLPVRLSPPLLEFWAVSESHTPCRWRARPGGGLRGQREVTIKDTSTKPQNWSTSMTVNCSALDMPCRESNSLTDHVTTSILACENIINPLSSPHFFIFYFEYKIETINMKFNCMSHIQRHS